MGLCWKTKDKHSSKHSRSRTIKLSPPILSAGIINHMKQKINPLKTFSKTQYCVAVLKTWCV